MKDPDVFGEAIKAFYYNNDHTNITVHSPNFDDDVIPITHLFRSFKEMPELEKIALKHATGHILDVGCGAGSHSLYLQNKLKLEVTAIDTSVGAVEIVEKRGIVNARCEDFFNLKNEKFDTILMLMNGSGIIGKLNNLSQFFPHARSLLTENGCILMDSSDLTFLFEEEIGSLNYYYGELEFQISYKNLKSETFDWLYIDFEKLKEVALENGFSCELIKKGRHFDYLAKLQQY